MLFNVYIISLINKHNGNTKTSTITAETHNQAIAQAFTDARIKEDQRSRWQAKVTQVSQFRLT